MRQDIANYITERDGHPCDPNNVFLSTGATEAIKVGCPAAHPSILEPHSCLYYCLGHAIENKRMSGCISSLMSADGARVDAMECYDGARCYDDELNLTQLHFHCWVPQFS